MKYRKDGQPDGRSLMKREHHACNWRCTEIQRALAVYPPVTLEAIGGRLGITRERARQLIAEHGWKKPPAKFALSRNGGWLCQTCKQRVPARGTREEANAIMREHSATHVNPHRRRWEIDALIAAMYLADWRVRDIVKEVGLGPKPEVIYRRLQRAGIKANRGNNFARVYVNGRLMRKQDAERLAAGSTLVE